MMTANQRYYYEIVVQDALDDARQEMERRLLVPHARRIQAALRRKLPAIRKRAQREVTGPSGPGR